MVLCKNSLIIIIPSLPELAPSAATSRAINTDKALPDRPTDSRGTGTAGRPRDANPNTQQLGQEQITDISPQSLLNSASRGGRNLPIINRPSPGQTEKGMGGVPVQGQLFPPIRSNTAPVVLQKPPKKSLKKDGKLVISKPVIRESSSQNLMSKIATVDLATAAKNDRERRAMQPTAAAIIRPATAAQPDSLKNPQVFKRKEVAATATTVSPDTKRTSALLAPDATSTAAQVSPGVEDLRRRSPGSMFKHEQNASTNSEVLPHIAATMISPPPRSIKRPSVVGSQLSTHSTAPIIPPQNPKRQSSKSPLRDGSSTRVFIDPNTPPAIPSPLRHPKPKWPSSTDMASPLVPRVKPLPMPFSKNHHDAGPAEEHGEPPIESRLPLLSHKGSVKRDIRPSRQRPQSPVPENHAPAKTPVQMRLMSGIPLNPRSRYAPGPGPGLDDTGYAVMFINGTDNANVGYAQKKQADAERDSVVHRPRPIPRKSAIYKAEFSVKLSPALYHHRRSRSGGSIELVRTSMASSSEMLSSIPPFPQPPRSASAVMVKNTSHELAKRYGFETPLTGLDQTSPTTHRGLATGGTTAPSTTTTSSSGKFHNESRRQSSPILPASELRQLSMVVAGDKERLSGATAVAPSRSPRQEATSTSLDMDEVDPIGNDGRETVVVMLDTASEGSHSARSTRNSNSDSVTPASWHRRVGDVCPTFSVRNAGRRSLRRVPPPTPLLLSKSTRSVLVAETQPSPLESPQHALDEIQQQLKRLELAVQDEGPDRRDEPGAEARDKQRRTLLENIEAEMGLQESHWLQIREGLAGRSPPSSRWTQAQTPASSDSNLPTPAPSPNKSAPAESEGESGSGRSGDVAGAGPWPRPRQNRPGDRKMESPRSPLDESAVLRRLRHSGGAGGVSITSDDASAGLGFVGGGGAQSRTEPGTPSTPSTPSSPAQNKRLLSARIRAVAHRLSSPTPPDSDESDAEAVENIDFNLIGPANFVTSPVQASFAQAGLTRTLGGSPSAYQPPHQPVSHWSIGSDATSVASQIIQSPGLAYETFASDTQLESLPDTSKFDSPTRIINDYKDDGTPTSGSSERNIFSLSSSSAQPIESSPRRTLAQKPPRKSKRITLLPDIPESPKPLENKRGTLGIFQFPWGETSDIATLQPQRIAYMAMPGTMASGVPLVQAPMLESQGYPTSFFDHYDDDDRSAAAADSDGSTGGYSDDDEDFDETTLWEIASLLKSDKIPSRDSLFPDYESARPPSRAGFSTEAPRVEDKVAEQDSATEKPLPSLPPAHPLWKKPVAVKVSRDDKWMPQPEKKVWRALLDANSQSLRAPLRKAEFTPITSNSLWKPVEKVTQQPKTRTIRLWEKPTQTSVPRPEHTKASEAAINQAGPAQLWTAPIIVPRVYKGLPQAPESWNKYLTQKVKSERAKPRAAKETPIKSSSLWNTLNQTTKQNMTPEQALSTPPTSLPLPQSPSTMHQLWTPPPKLPEEHTPGLFSLSHIRHNYRTSPNKPAALETQRKLRIDARPLQPLRSNSLWSRAAVSRILAPPSPPNWLALSLQQQRPISPASASVADSDVSDASSAYSEETETSTLASQTPHRKRAAAAAATTVAEKEELDATLQEALASRRPLAEPAEDKLFFDVTTAHPVFAVDVLHITSDTCHPAATGYLHSVINGAPRKKARVVARNAM